MFREPLPSIEEPTALDVAAYMGMKIAEYGCYVVMLAAAALFYVL